MSSTHVLLVPIIACVVVGGIILALALWVAVAKMALTRSQRRVSDAAYTRTIWHAQQADDLVCKLILAIEKSSSTADVLLGPELEQEIYDAHSRYVELGTARKGIS